MTRPHLKLPRSGGSGSFNGFLSQNRHEMRYIYLKKTKIPQLFLKREVLERLLSLPLQTIFENEGNLSVDRLSFFLSGGGFLLRLSVSCNVL